MPAVSHPLWVRGLKLFPLPCSTPYNQVASFMGAWIETLRQKFARLAAFVASFMGAWIETTVFPATLKSSIVASFMGAWIETQQVCQCWVEIPVASFMGAWIETCPNCYRSRRICRILYGCVD